MGEEENFDVLSNTELSNAIQSAYLRATGGAKELSEYTVLHFTALCAEQRRRAHPVEISLDSNLLATPSLGAVFDGHSLGDAAIREEDDVCRFESLTQNPESINHADSVKLSGNEIVALMRQGSVPNEADRVIAIRKIEEAVMWFTKSVTV